MHLFVILIIVPLIEIGLFVQVGGAIGLFPTLAIVVATAAAGTLLLRSQAALVFQDIVSSVNSGQDPSKHLLHGLLVFAAGLLLLTPGFFTDAVGLALMFPPVREALLRWARQHLFERTAHYAMRSGFASSGRSGARKGDGLTIDADNPGEGRRE